MPLSAPFHFFSPFHYKKKYHIELTLQSISSFIHIFLLLLTPSYPSHILPFAGSLSLAIFVILPVLNITKN